MTTANCLFRVQCDCWAESSLLGGRKVTEDALLVNQVKMVDRDRSGSGVGETLVDSGYFVMTELV